MEAGLTALDWIAQGYGYEIIGADVWSAFSYAMKAAVRLGREGDFIERVREIARRYRSGQNLVAHVLARELA